MVRLLPLPLPRAELFLFLEKAFSGGWRPPDGPVERKHCVNPDGPHGPSTGGNRISRQNTALREGTDTAARLAGKTAVHLGRGVRYGWSTLGGLWLLMFDQNDRRQTD